MSDENAAAPRDERTCAAVRDYDGRLPTLDEQDWPEKPEWPGDDGTIFPKWRSWD